MSPDEIVEVRLDAAVVRLDATDWARLDGRSIYLGVNGYAYFSTWRDGPVTVHSFVMGGSKPGMHIDHLDGDKLNNCRSNLRFVSPQANQVNRKRLSKANTSGIRGVGLSKASKAKPWQAQISVNGKTIHLGLFANQEDAVTARRQAELHYFSEECPRV